jgi:hypothetical protein
MYAFIQSELGNTGRFQTTGRLQSSLKKEKKSQETVFLCIRRRTDSLFFFLFF